jgi:hypothetical protein
LVIADFRPVLQKPDAANGERNTLSHEPGIGKCIPGCIGDLDGNPVRGAIGKYLVICR